VGRWVEGWRDGGMEGWRDGGMEGWREGEWVSGCMDAWPQYFKFYLLLLKAVQIAREVTKIYDNNDTAVIEFRKLLNSNKSYFNEDPIPRNEINEEAYRRCSDLEGAKKYCPTRWEAMQKWFKKAREV
jgi:hypothetical protein